MPRIILEDTSDPPPLRAFLSDDENGMVELRVRDGDFNSWKILTLENDGCISLCKPNIPSKFGIKLDAYGQVPVKGDPPP